MVGYAVVQVDGDGYALDLTEGLKVDDRERVLVVRHHVSARVGDINLVADDVELVGLETDDAGVDHLQGGGVNLRHIAMLLVGTIEGCSHRPGITGEVGKSAMKLDVSAVGHVDLPDAFCAQVHHLDLV